MLCYIVETDQARQLVRNRRHLRKSKVSTHSQSMKSSRTKRLPDRTSANTDDDADAPIDRPNHLESGSNEEAIPAENHHGVPRPNPKESTTEVVRTRYGRESRVPKRYGIHKP